MANHQKDNKKVATKAPKSAGGKVPKYAQQEVSTVLDLSPLKSASKAKK